tara:strand:+ start:1137 stop:1400 length:264 start_codon:yes stop_codon:yes gene_type:complete
MPGESNETTSNDAVIILKEQIAVTSNELIAARTAKNNKWVKNVEAVLAQQEANLVVTEAQFTILVNGGTLPFPTFMFGTASTILNGF